MVLLAEQRISEPPVAISGYTPTMEGAPGDVTMLLEDVRRGLPDAESQLVSLLYTELKRLARSYMRRERVGHTLGATGLVHEAYLRLAGGNQNWQNRAQFLSAAACAMRRVLVDYARAHRAKKRGDGRAFVPFDDGILFSGVNWDRVIEVDAALDKLRKLDPKKAQLVELREFMGLSIDEAAEVMQCSSRTVKRHWEVVQRWLGRELSAK